MSFFLVAFWWFGAVVTILSAYIEVVDIRIVTFLSFLMLAIYDSFA